MQRKITTLARTGKDASDSDLKWETDYPLLVVQGKEICLTCWNHLIG